MPSGVIFSVTTDCSQGAYTVRMVADMIASHRSGLSMLQLLTLALGENRRVGPHGHGPFCGYFC
jgi:hypothetical protein